ASRRNRSAGRGACLKQALLALLLVAGALQLAACDRLRTAVELPSSDPSLLATTTATLPTPTLAVALTPSPFPSATPLNPDSGWLPLRQGIEQRILNIAAAGEWVESITILRLDPAHF